MEKDKVKRIGKKVNKQISRTKHPLFEFIKASPFFQVYAPNVTNWKHKMRGTDGNQKQISFSESDLKQIRAGLTKLFKDLKEIK
jgi:hypothetical protein